MKVKEAVQTAVNDVQDLFQGERITNLGLEEVDYDDSSEEWIVTVGFSRPWDYSDVGVNAGALAAVLTPRTSQPNRSFKVVRVKDSDGRVVSVKNRTSGVI